MKEILAEELDQAILDLQLVAQKTYQDDIYQIWQMEDSEFDKLCNIREEDWKDSWGMWRSATGSVLDGEVKLLRP